MQFFIDLCYSEISIDHQQILFIDYAMPKFKEWENMKRINYNIFILILFLLTFLSFFATFIHSQDYLISLSNFEKLDESKKQGFLKEAIENYPFESKLVYYIHRTKKVEYFFTIWEEKIYSLTRGNLDSEIIIKREQILLIISAFSGKASYLERNFIKIQNIDNTELEFAKNIYNFLYSFENSKSYLEAKKYLLEFFKKDKVIAYYFFNNTDLVKIQQLILSNFENFIDIIPDSLLIAKLKESRSEESTKWIISILIEEKPSLIMQEFEIILSTSSNDLNAWFIRLLAEKKDKLGKNDKKKIGEQLNRTLGISSSFVVLQSIYFYFSSVEPQYYIKQFNSFYNKASDLLKVEVVRYLLNVNLPQQFEVLCNVYSNETIQWNKDRIYEQLLSYSQKELPLDLAYNFLQAFSDLNEDRFTKIKANFLFYFNNEQQELSKKVRLEALKSLKINFCESIYPEVQLYIPQEKDVELLKFTLQILVDNGKENLLKEPIFKITQKPVSFEEYTKNPQYYNFIIELLILSLDKNLVYRSLNFLKPVLQEITSRPDILSKTDLEDLKNRIDGLFSKVQPFIIENNETNLNLRKTIFKVCYFLDLDNSINQILRFENNETLFLYMLDVIYQNPKRSVASGLIKSSANFDSDMILRKISSTMIKIIEQNPGLNPFIFVLDNSIWTNPNFLLASYYIIYETNNYDYLKSFSNTYKNINEDKKTSQILYKMFQSFLIKVKDEKKIQDITSFILDFEKVRSIFYLSLLEKEIEINNKIVVIELLKDKECFDCVDTLLYLAATVIKSGGTKSTNLDFNLVIKLNTTIIDTISKLGNSYTFSKLLPVAEYYHENRDIQYSFAKGAYSNMSLDITPYIIKLTVYPDPMVKEAALLALGMLPLENTLPILIQQYKLDKNPEPLLLYFSKADNDLKKYWISSIIENFDQKKCLSIILDGIYPYKILKFDNVILESVLPMVDQDFYSNLVILKLSKLSTDELKQASELIPFIIISNDYKRARPYLLFLIETKNYDLAKYTFVSKSANLVNYFLDQSSQIKGINWSTLFDLRYSYYGADGFKELFPILYKNSKYIGSSNIVHLFDLLPIREQTVTLLISLYPLKFSEEDLNLIISKDLTLLPVILNQINSKIEEKEKILKIALYNSFKFSKSEMQSLLNFSNPFIPDDFEQIALDFYKLEEREEIKAIVSHYLIEFIDDETELTSTIEESIVENLYINDTESAIKAISLSSNAGFIPQICKYIDTKDISWSFFFSKVILARNNKIKENILFSLFLLDTKLFENIATSTRITISSPYILKYIVLQYESLNKNMYEIIFNSIMKMSDKSLSINYQFEKEKIFSSKIYLLDDIYNKALQNLDKDMKTKTLSYLLHILDIKDDNEKEVLIFLRDLSISNLSISESVNYLNKLINKTEINEIELFNLCKNIDSGYLLNILPLTSLSNFDFATSYYLSYLESIGMPYQYAKILFLKLDKKQVASFLLSKNLPYEQLVRYIPLVPEILLQSDEIKSKYPLEQLIKVYYKEKSYQLFLYLVENKLITLDDLIKQARKSYDKKTIFDHTIIYNKIENLSFSSINILINALDVHSKKLSKSEKLKELDVVLRLLFYNIKSYDEVDEIIVINNLLNLVPIDLLITKRNDLNFYIENTQNSEDISFLLLKCSFFIDENRISAFANYCNLPLYTGFKDILRVDFEKLKTLVIKNDIIKSNRVKSISDYDYLHFISDVLIILLKNYPDSKLIDENVVVYLKDNNEMVKTFWEIVINLKIPGLEFLFDKYFGGAKWEKIKKSYISIWQ
ncbi:MAG: hypothetical protein GX435_03645 [Exilispira sp.]|nr:hypothetical protein [Exilispira sp.]